MLRYGEYSPNNPQLRVTAAPYLGLGEYEQRRQLIFKQRQADYREHILRVNWNLIIQVVVDTGHSLTFSLYKVVVHKTQVVVVKTNKYSKYYLFPLLIKGKRTRYP